MSGFPVFLRVLDVPRRGGGGEFSPHSSLLGFFRALRHPRDARSAFKLSAVPSGLAHLCLF